MPSPRNAAQRPSPAELHEALQVGTYAEVAAHFGVVESTVARWRQRREYREFLAELQEQARDRVIGAAARDYELAMSTARRVAAHDDPHASLNGARLLLDTHEKLRIAPPAQADPDEDKAEGVLSRVRGALARARGASNKS